MKITFHANRRRRTHFLILTALITAGMVARMDGADNPPTTLTIPADVSALMTPSRCYVAVHDAVGYPYQLTCIDRVTAKVIWKSEVFGSWWGGASGVHETQVAVTEQNGRIVLFGAGSTGIHVEAFRLEDGGNLFRFSSSY